MLKLMYITNRPEIALTAQSAGVDRIFVDMEFIGKDARQKGLDTVKSHHTVEDVRTIKSVLDSSELLVRVNPIHEALDDYPSSEREIDEVIDAGADIVMLPYFKSAEEVDLFLSYVGGRAKTMLLLETPEAADRLDAILALPGIDFIHIGLNDLSLALGRKFMFELLADGTVEYLCRRIRESGIPYGFGGVASVGKGLLPAEYIIKEHYYLGSDCAILSRSFCDVSGDKQLEEIERIFNEGVREIRMLEAECRTHLDLISRHEEAPDYFTENERLLKEKVAAVCRSIAERN